MITPPWRRHTDYSKKPPLFLRYRTSTTFIALTVALGILVDLSGYGLVVPVVPFRLEDLGYDNIPSRTGWLVAAYAGGLIVSSPPIAWVGAKISERRGPLVFALLFMAGALVLFMETASYEALVISRVLQGVAGTGIWTLGLALAVDSIPKERFGIVMGYIMIGFSLGQLIGPPVVLYERLGYRAPFVFALCLVFVDLVLRLLIIEKREAIKWIAAGHEIVGFEAPGYSSSTAPAKLAPVEETAGSPPAALLAAEEKEMEKEKKPTVWGGLLKMVTEGRPLTLFALSLLDGIILGGLLDTGMVLWVQYEYSLDSLGAGLVFIGAVVPGFFASPLAGWACDKWGAKGVASIGLVLATPAMCLLIIEGPLPLFIFFLALIGTSLAMFLTPLMQDLSIVVSHTPGLVSTHVYGCFNMCYSIGSFVGPIIAGQVIEAIGIRKGWIALCTMCSGMAVVLMPFVVWYVGGPLKRLRSKEVGLEEQKEVQSEQEA